MGIPTMVKKGSKGAAPKVEFPRSAIEKKPRVFSIGGDILPGKRDLTRFVKWPKYVRLQRSKMTLLKRIKIPPAINQFTQTFDKKQASQLFRLLNNLKPETAAEKKERRNSQAEAVAAGGKVSNKKPVCVKQGLNHVTTLCEDRGVPYCIVKSKSRVGAVVGMKTATCLAITDVKPENKNDLANLITMADANFASVYDEHQRKWGDAESSGRQKAHMAKLNARK